MVCIFNEEKLLVQKKYENLDKIDIAKMDFFIQSVDRDRDWELESYVPVNEEIIKISNTSKYKPAGISLAYPPYDNNYFVVENRCHISKISLIKIWHLKKNHIKSGILKEVLYKDMPDYDIIYF